jgi:hypothetical protein
MRRHITTLATITLTTCALGSAGAQSATLDSAALVHITLRLLDGITYGDSSVWAKHLSARWFLTDEEGHHLTRAQFIGDLHGLPAGQSGQLRIANVHFLDATGVAILSYDIDESHDFYGQKLQTRFHTTDTWVLEGAQPKILASQTTALPTAIEGRGLPRALLDQYAGRYSLTPQIELRLVATDSGLLMVRGTSPGTRLYFIDDRIFVRHGVRGFWLLERDAGGEVVRLVNWRDNNPVIWRRRLAR